MAAKYTYTKNNINIIIFILCIFVSNKTVAQSSSFLSGNKTGNRYQSGALIGLGTGNATVTTPMLPHTTGIISTLRFYYGDTILNSTSVNNTTVIASRVLGIGGILGAGGDAYIEFRNTSNTTIASGTTTYFKIGQAPAITGLGVPVGGILGLTDVYDIRGYGYSGAGNYVLGSSYNENTGTLAGTKNGTKTKILIDKNGTWYIGVTPDAAYNAVRLNVAFAASVNLVNLSRDLSVNVYNAFYYSLPPGIDCGTPIFTTPGEGQGISLNLGSTTQLLALDTAVSNPENAIDDDSSTYSRITSGALGIASAISQTILFNNNGTDSDVVAIKLSLPLSALTAAVLPYLTITAYNGETIAGSPLSASAFLDVDVLGLLGDNTPFYANLKPGVRFDRVTISLGNLAAISPSILGGGIRIYQVKRVTNAPNIITHPANDTVCTGDDAIFTVTASGDALTYSWQTYESGTWTDAGNTTNTLNINNVTTAMNGRKYRVNVSGGYCTSSHATFTSNEATLIVKQLPETPPVHIRQ